MCSIAGYVTATERERGASRVLRALCAMNHRGPDDEGVTLLRPEDGEAYDFTTDGTAAGVGVPQHVRAAEGVLHTIAMGHGRFSLVDVSPTGHQPLWTPDRSVCVAFNGEIYNYVELRKELERAGVRFRSTSDTEVLAAAYRQWGTDCFGRFNGFWALTLYDARSRRLLLARDRIGEAPLYVTRLGGNLHWASELKGLFAMLDPASFHVREQAVADFMFYHRRDIYDATFYEEVDSFPRASYAWVRPDGGYEAVRYWSVPSRRLAARDISVSEAEAKLRALLTEAVRLRLRADVPVAAQLSGGMDSSTLVALAAQDSRDVHAYTVAYPDPGVDEEPFARQVAEHYSDHVTYHVISPPEDDFLEHADAYVFMMGEPFHSPNQFASQRIWRVMREHGFRATLYGAAGDELFAGYSWDYFEPYLKELLRRGRLVRFAREFMQFSERQNGHSNYLSRAGRLLPARFHHIGRRARGGPDGVDAYVPPQGVGPQEGPSDRIEERLIEFMGDWRMNYWQRIDNQNSMGVPLELRLPYLDHGVVEFAFRLPLEYLIRDGWLKWILRHSMQDRLPDGITWRRLKQGFPFPLEGWLAASRDRLLGMLEPLDCPYVDMGRLHRGYDVMRRSNASRLWCLLSLALWWKRCIQGDRLQ